MSTDLAVRPTAEVATAPPVFVPGYTRPAWHRWLPLSFAVLVDALAGAWLWLGPAAVTDRQILPITATCAVVTGIGFWRAAR